jgi:CAAX protease family protein
MHWDYALILIFLGAVVPLLGRWRVNRILRGPDTTQTDRLRIYASTIAFQWALVAIILWRTSVYGTNAAALGLAAPRPLLTVLVSAGLVGLVLANQLISLRLIGTRPEELQSKLAQVALRIFPQGTLERLVFFGVVCTVAICEEVIFRGFVQSLFAALTDVAFMGILLSSAWFSVAHLYQGWRGLISTFVVGLLFSVTHSWTGSLIPAVAAHFAIDFVAGFAFPTRLREALAKTAMPENSSAS